MSGGGGKTISTESPRIATVRINQSAYGAAITWLRGTNRIAGNLIDYDDFTAIPHTTTQEMGGKGGGGGGMKSTTYSYTCAFVMALCEGPIHGIGQVWSAKDKTTTGALGMTVFSGALPQSPWGYMESRHPEKALSYPGIAYVAHGAIDLGDSANMPNLSFEVSGPRTPSELIDGEPVLDARPDEILTDLLTDSLSGVGFSGERLHGLTSWRTYCQAAGFFVSPAISEQAAAADHIRQLMAMTNSDVVWSEGKLKIVPYADTPVSGNGVSYTPDVTPLFDLTDDDFLPLDTLSVIRAHRKRSADAFNRVQIEFCNRAIEYNTDLGEAKDAANIAQFGLRPKSPVQMHWITRKEMADQVADLILRRELYVLNEYEIKLGWRYAMLEPMDIVTLTHAPLGLDRATVRVVSVEEAPDGELDLVVEDMPWAVSTPARVITQGGNGSSVDFNVSPGNANEPVIFEPPVSLAGRPEIWLGTSGGGTWGGAEVWVSLDNATYTRVGNVVSPARHGTLSAAMPLGGDPDVSTTLSVDLGVSHATLLSGNEEDRDLLNTLCYVDGELVSYRDAALTGSFRYDLTSLRRGAYGSPIGAHASGARFLRLDGAVFKYAYDKSYVGKTLYVKLRSYNIYGGALQDLAALSPVAFDIAGAPVGSVGGLAAEQPFTGTTARIVWSAMDGARYYKVEVWAGGAMRRTVETQDTRFAYSFEDGKADGGPWRTLQFHVYAATDTGLSETSATLQLTNPQMAGPAAVSVTSMMEGLNIRCMLPADTDYAGCRVHASQTQGFTPDSNNLVYRGREPEFSWFDLPAGEKWYLRIGLYDVFGEDAMLFSSEQIVTVRGISADPAATLAEINNLLTDGSGAAKIELLADRFSIKSPSGDKIPFALVEAAPGVWKTMLNSDVLIGGNVSVANLTEGALPNDVIFSLGGGTVQLDGMGEIRAYADVGANQDFVRLTAAQINFMRYIEGTGYVTYNYLSRLETGAANSGDTVTIPGYWRQQPRVMVSPAALPLYKAAYAAQDQTIACVAESLQETAVGSGRWQFVARANLSLGAASGGGALNAGSGDQSSNTYTSATQTTPANCTDITPSVSLKSVRGAGNGQYYRRSVKWRVEYYNGSSWVSAAWRTVAIGDQLDAVTDSQKYTFPSAAAWQWRIAYEAFDTDGSVFGAAEYTYQQQTVSATADEQLAQESIPDISITVTLPAHSLSGEVYQVDYAWSCKTRGEFTGESSVYGKFYDFGLTSYGASHNISYTRTQISVGNYSDSAPSSWLGTFTHAGSSLTFDQTAHSRLLWTSDSGVYAADLKIYDISVSATVRTRTPVVSSTTPTNAFLLSSYLYNLSSAQVLAAGSLNWMAVGL